MRTIMQLVAVWVAAALAACSVKPAIFTQGDGQFADASQPVMRRAAMQRHRHSS